MSRYFVTDPPVPVYEFEPGHELPPNIIWIRAKMDVATDAKVKSELLQLGSDQKTIEAHIGANQMALLIHNIVRWEGPDLDGVPCTAAQIRTLDPTEPHLARVLEEIARRNRRPAGPSPKSAGASSSASAGAADSREAGAAANPVSAPGLSAQLATGTSRSRSQRALDGRLTRSGD